VAACVYAQDHPIESCLWFEGPERGSCSQKQAEDLNTRGREKRKTEKLERGQRCVFMPQVRNGTSSNIKPTGGGAFKRDAGRKRRGTKYERVIAKLGGLGGEDGFKAL